MTDFEKDNFCLLETSRLLKDVGYNEECAGYFASGHFNSLSTYRPVNNSNFPTAIAAPTFLSARKWLREKHGIDVNTEWDTVAFGYKIIVVDILETIKYWHFQSEPEAWNAAIIRACEIIKERK